jgi:hypothetical protein
MRREYGQEPSGMPRENCLSLAMDTEFEVDALLVGINGARSALQYANHLQVGEALNHQHQYFTLACGEALHTRDHIWRNPSLLVRHKCAIL